MDPAVLGEGISKHYGSGRARVDVLHGVDLRIDPGGIVALMGPSGCGKTTLLNCLSGIDRPDSGRVVVGGKDLAKMGDRERTRHRGQTMGYVFQAFNLVPVLNAVQNVELPLRLGGMRRAAARSAASEALEAVGLQDRINHSPLQMSGGQQQRVAIARAIVNKPYVVWADEPTGNLDRSSGEQIINLFKRLNKELGTTFFMVTHDSHVARAAHRTVHMVDGRIK